MASLRRFGLLPLVAILGAVASMQDAAGQAMTLAPHRAIYELTLDSARTTSKIDRAHGRIAFEVTGNACQGYAVTLRQVTRLDTGEGRETTSDLRSTTWEDGAAKSYRFKSQNYLNQQLRDDVDGSAERAKDGGFVVRLAKPKSAPFELKGPILLPTEHLRRMLAAGSARERFLEARVYDGAPDGKRVYDTLAVIGDAIDGAADLEEAVQKPELAALKRYPITISYFEPGTGERTPAYVLGFEVYENGVSRALRLDYGGFALRGELTSLALLKPAPCKR